MRGSNVPDTAVISNWRSPYPSSGKTKLCMGLHGARLGIPIVLAAAETAAGCRQGAASCEPSHSPGLIAGHSPATNISCPLSTQHISFPSHKHTMCSVAEQAALHGSPCLTYWMHWHSLRLLLYSMQNDFPQPDRSRKRHHPQFTIAQTMI